jgi:predicted RNA polymerase sigma factor
VSEAVVEALAQWPERGVPERPGAWLFTTARNKGLDRLRRERTYRRKLELLARIPESPAREPDDRLRLIFTCCHPALGGDAQVALTLRAVVGLTSAEIARAFLIPEATLVKRITRAKRKIVVAGVPYREPEPEDLPERLTQVLRVIYLVFNEGYFTTSGPQGLRRELADDSEWLASQLVAWLPGEPEPLGLLALIRLHLARWKARSGPGGLVLLPDQDRTLWDRERIAGATRILERAASLGRLGPYQIEAAIVAVHCEAPAWENTDWPQLLELYSLLEYFDSSPVVTLNRAVVVAQVRGPRAALELVDGLRPALERYHLFHAVRASLLRRLGSQSEAAEEDAAALRLTSNPAERAILAERLEFAQTHESST